MTPSQELMTLQVPEAAACGLAVCNWRRSAMSGKTPWEVMNERARLARGPKPAPQPKVLRRLPVPLELRSFLSAVHLDLRSGCRDDLSGADDQFQCRYAYGGRDDEDPNQFLFTYFPTEGVGQKWELRLYRTEVEDIADGVLGELSLWCCPSTGCQCASWNEGELCPRHDYGKTAWQDLARVPARRTEAIKAYREEHGVGMAEAKRAVEDYLRGQTPSPTEPDRRSPPT
jgi:hypothetical protein